MKALIKDFFNFERKRSHKEAAVFLVFHSCILLLVMAVVQVIG